MNTLSQTKPVDPSTPMLISLTVAECDGILGMLQEQPFKLVQGIITKIVMQLNNQPPQAQPQGPTLDELAPRIQ